VTGERLPYLCDRLQEFGGASVFAEMSALAVRTGAINLGQGFWCPHCQRELPRLSGWLAANDLPAGVEVIAVSTAVDSGRGNYPPSAWFAQEQWPAVAVRDSESNEISDAYGLRGFPYTVGIDADGRVVARVSGELNDAAWEFLLGLVAPAAG